MAKIAVTVCVVEFFSLRKRGFFVQEKLYLGLLFMDVFMLIFLLRVFRFVYWRPQTVLLLPQTNKDMTFTLQ